MSVRLLFFHSMTLCRYIITDRWCWMTGDHMDYRHWEGVTHPKKDFSNPCGALTNGWVFLWVELRYDVHHPFLCYAGEDDRNAMPYRPMVTQWTSTNLFSSCVSNDLLYLQYLNYVLWCCVWMFSTKIPRFQNPCLAFLLSNISPFHSLSQMQHIKMPHTDASKCR